VETSPFLKAVCLIYNSSNWQDIPGVEIFVSTLTARASAIRKPQPCSDVSTGTLALLNVNSWPCEIEWMNIASADQQQ